MTCGCCCPDTCPLGKRCSLGWWRCLGASSGTGQPSSWPRACSWMMCGCCCPDTCPLGKVYTTSLCRSTLRAHILYKYKAVSPLGHLSYPHCLTLEYLEGILCDLSLRSIARFRIVYTYLSPDLERSSLVDMPANDSQDERLKNMESTDQTPNRSKSAASRSWRALYR